MPITDLSDVQREIAALQEDITTLRRTLDYLQYDVIEDLRRDVAALESAAR
jgi:hypothetical protein